jgi:phage baseplate assembly protein gpV
MSDLDLIYRLLGSLLERSVEHDRRIAGGKFYGPVAEVDASKHSVRLKIGQTPEGEDVLSPWVRVAEKAGALIVHDMPSVGEQCVIETQAGDIELGVVRPLHYSSDNPSISDDPSEKLLQFGSVAIRLTDDSISLAVGENSISISGDGIVANGAFKHLGPEVTHNGVNIGDDHVHSGVTVGADKTDKPE